MRPQATIFSESAKNRESVMSLGSIAHLQYYFARTGLLDGKGAQFARKSTDPKGRPTSRMASRSMSLNLPSNSSTMPGSPVESNMSESAVFSESPVEQDGEVDWDLALLPPTVSTYNHRPAYVPPPPNLTMLRKELTEALEDALKVLKEAEKPVDGTWLCMHSVVIRSNNFVDSPGWYEIQGLHLLDIVTLAIRAAKNYYTAHSQYQRLHAIKSERQIRSELYQVLEILKRMAARNFAGGMRQNEKVAILTWIVGISELIQAEIDEEKREAEKREKWIWRTGEWTGKEREREFLFIKSFIEKPDDLPDWTAPPETDEGFEPTPFLKHFQTGLELVHLHNTMVRKSRRRFEEIKVYHTDTAKPYRCAENLRYFLKAGELRWGVFAKVDVMGVVHGTTAAVWRAFDEAILKWTKAVREEIMAELADARDANGERVLPRLNVQPETPVSVTSYPQATEAQAVEETDAEPVAAMS
jgi:hypothetical protein